MLLCVLLVLPFCIAIPTNLEDAFEMEPYNTMPAPTKTLATPRMFERLSTKTSSYARNITIEPF